MSKNYQCFSTLENKMKKKQLDFPQQKHINFREKPSNYQHKKHLIRVTIFNQLLDNRNVCVCVLFFSSPIITTRLVYNWDCHALWKANFQLQYDLKSETNWAFDLFQIIVEQFSWHLKGKQNVQLQAKVNH